MKNFREKKNENTQKKVLENEAENHRQMTMAIERERQTQVNEEELKKNAMRQVDQLCNLPSTLCPNLSSTFFNKFREISTVLPFTEASQTPFLVKTSFSRVFCASHGFCDENLRCRNKFSPFAL